MPSRLLVVFLAAVLPSGCALPELRELGCGDSVLSAGEDCDGRYAVDGLTCGAVGTPNECRYVCTQSADCPEGWRCGIEERCYRPQPMFEDLTPRTPLPTGISGVSDVDGDGVGDVAGSDGATVSVSFGDDTDAFSASFGLGLPLLSGEAWLARFDGDALADLLIPLERALLIFSGRATREVVSRLFASGRATGEVLQAAGAVVQADGDVASELLVVVETAAGSSMAFRDAGCAETALPGGRPVSHLITPGFATAQTSARRIPVADLDGNGISEFALAFRGSPTLYLYTSTGSDPAACPSPTPYLEIALPDGYELADGSVLFVDLDGDGDLDVLMPVFQAGAVELPADSPRPLEQIWVAHALGGGTYEPTPTAIEELMPELLGGLGSGPIAAGDLDGNGLADYVLDHGVFLTMPPGDGEQSRKLVPILAPRHLIWSEAAVVDINADGALDIVTANFQRRGIDWFVNAGVVGLPGLFNPFVVDTGFPVARLSLGDFNGDFATDVAAIELRLGDVPDELLVVFSTGAGLPGEAQPNGSLGKHTWFMGASLLPDPSSRDIDAIDGISDLMILNSAQPSDPMAPAAQEAHFYDLLGSTSQMLLSPLYVFDDAGVSGDPRAAMVVATGDFVSRDDAEAASRSVVVLSVPESVRSNPGQGASDTSLTLLTSTPTGALQPADVSQELIVELSGFHPSCEIWLVGDVDVAGETRGVDELVGVERQLGCNPDQTSPTLSILVIRLSELAGQSSLERISLPEHITITMAYLADLDRDGGQDLVLVATPAAIEGPLAEVLVLWNDPSCAPLPFCMERSIRLPVQELRADPQAPGLWPGGVAIVQITGDERRELAVLYNNDADATAGSVVLTFASSADTPRDYLRLEDEPELADDTRIDRLITGDVNGDGLDDLLFVQPNLTGVLVQVPAEPMGTTLAREEQP